MKTIFIFNDSALTARHQNFSALGEDGQLVSTAVFDRHTAPYAEYAMGSVHELDACIAPGIAEPLTITRRNVLATYDRVYGAGNWIPMWLDTPVHNFAWCRAMRLYRSRIESSSVSFSAAALDRILGAVFSDQAPSDKRSVH